MTKQKQDFLHLCKFMKKEKLKYHIDISIQTLYYYVEAPLAAITASTLVLAVCLWSLPCWKVKLWLSLRSWALCTRFSFRISLYFAPISISSTLTSLPVPAAEKHPHMMLPPPCFTFGMVWHGMSGAWFPPDMTLKIEAKHFNLGLIRPENLVSKSCPINWNYHIGTPIKV